MRSHCDTLARSLQCLSVGGRLGWRITMAGNNVGGLKLAARAAGLSLQAFSEIYATGQRRCGACERWLPSDELGVDRTRPDGVHRTCKSCRNSRERAKYMPKPRPAHREPYGPDGNRRSACTRINQRIRRGELTHPKHLPCTDCGHVWVEGGRRHEYDHAWGYAGKNALRVEPVCTLCHHRRGVERGTHVRKRGSNGKFVS